MTAHLTDSRMSIAGTRPSQSAADTGHRNPVEAGLPPASPACWQAHWRADGQPCQVADRGRRRALSGLTIPLLLAGGLIGGCASLLDRDPVRIDVVGVDPLESQSLEWRFAVRLRIQNPNQTPIEFDGAAVEIDVRGVRLGSGVSDQRGTVPRFGETLVTLPITVPVSALLRQGLAFARNPEGRTDYLVRGKLAGPVFGSTRFESRGELTLPALR